MTEGNQHVVEFASRFSSSSLSSPPPCVVATPPSLAVATIPPRDPIGVEIVNINRLFSSSGDMGRRREEFRKKYEQKKALAIEIDVCKLNPPPPKDKSSRSKKPYSHGARRMSQTIKFDEDGRVVHQEFVQSQSAVSEESSLYDEDEDPFNDDFDFGDAFRLSDLPQDKACQTFFVKFTVSALTQTPASEISTTSSQTPGKKCVDSGVQVQPKQNDLNKLPNIVVTPPAGKLNNFIVKPPSIFSNKSDHSTGQNSKTNKLKSLFNDLHTKYVEKPGSAKQLNNSNVNNVASSVEAAEQPHKKSTKSIKQLFESKKKNVGEARSKTGVSDKLRHELRNSSVKQQIGAISAKEEDIPLLDQLLKEISLLPLYKLVEFEKSFVKSITDREFLDILKGRFKDKCDHQLVEIIKELVKSIDVDDMYDIFEQYINDRPYNECRKLSMKICENLLNKKDLTEFMMRNFSSMSEANKKVMATSLLQDLPYEAMKTVIELQLPKLKEKDIPSVLNNIQTDPNKRELEKAVCILSSRLSAEETQKLIRDLGKGMKQEEISKTIKQLFDYLPKRDSETIARRYVEVKKVLVEKWTETRAIEVRTRTVSKQVGTDPPKQEVKEARAEKSRKVVVLQGESWFANDRRCVNRATQTDAVNRLLFKDKTDLQNAAQVMSKAKKRFHDKANNNNNNSRPKVNREDVMLGVISPTTPRSPTPNSLAISKVETDGPSLTSPASVTVSTRKNLLDEIERLKQEKQNIYDDYQEYFNLALDQEEEIHFLEDELERTKRQINDQKLELHYLKEERDVAYTDIRDLEDELADSRIMIHDLRNRPLTVLTTGKDGKKVNVANTDRLTKELEKFQHLDEELALLQEDFLLMEQKWLAEQKRKKYFEEQAVIEEKKAREISHQLYMIMTNELTPANFKEKVMKQDPAALADLPQLTGSQLNALLTLFVAAGALPEDKVPKSSEIFTLEELQKSGQYTTDEVAGLLTGKISFYADTGTSEADKVPASHITSLAPGLVYTNRSAEATPASYAPPTSQTSNVPAPPQTPSAASAPPPPPPMAPAPPNAPLPPPAPPAPRPPNAPPPPPPAAPLPPAAPPAPRPPNAPPPPPTAPLPPAAPPAPRPPNAPPIGPTAPPAPPPKNAPPPPPPPPPAPPVLDSRLMTGKEGSGNPGNAPPGAFVPRGRLEDLKNRKGRKARNNTVVKKKTLTFGPTKPLKVFNWAKLPDAKAANSIWKDVDEIEMVTMLNLDEIDDLFQSKKSVKKDGPGDGKKKAIKIIDPKRAQNFTILLKKFKKTNEQLLDIVMNCDKDDEIPLDMWEQLLRYVPTKEEVQMLTDLDNDEETMSSLNRADRYFHSAISIYHYEERIKAVNFKKKFDERIKNITPKIRALIKASTEVVKSDKLKEMLTLLLGFGNYFNFGKRGNAMGFRLETLTKICDTKSADNQLTLLVYIVETVEMIFPDLDSFAEEISHVPVAAKVALAELKSDVNDLQGGNRLLIKEVDHMQKNPNLKGASVFQQQFKGFLNDIADTMTDLEQMMGDMKKKYTIATSHFAESSNVEPETFFGYFNTFILQYSDAKETLAKKREEEEKKKKKQLAAEMLPSGASSPTTRSRPISPNLQSTPTSPIPPELIVDLLPSLETLEQQDHDLLMNDLFSATPDSNEASLSTGSMRRRRKRKDQSTSSVSNLERER